jgi:hypothetical protein
MDNWEDIKKEILKDPEVKKAYDDLEVEYQILSDLVKLRNKLKSSWRKDWERLSRHCRDLKWGELIRV